MNWFFLLLITIYALDPLVTIASIGDERKPRTKSEAVATVVINALIIAGIIHYTR